MEKEVMNLAEAAAFLGTTRQTLAKMTKRGGVPYRLIGVGDERPSYRFSRTALIEWLAGRAPAGAGDVGRILGDQVQATHTMARERTERELSEAVAKARGEAPPARPKPPRAPQKAGGEASKGKRRVYTAAEKRFALRELAETYAGNQSRCARKMVLPCGESVNRVTLQSWLKKYGTPEGVPNDEE